MKKFLTYATLTMFAVATVLTSCNNEEDVRVTGVTLSEANTYLPVPFTDTLIATITPENATNRNLIWTTTNEDIADVDRYGVVTAIAPGEVTITVTTEDGNFSASRTYQIQAQHFPVTGITLNHTEWHTTAIGATQTLEATVEPANASFPAVKWTSDNENVATVSDEGVVTSVGGGTARIRATAVNYPEIYAECVVTMEIILVQSITANREGDNITLHFWGEETAGVLRLVATPLPMNATNRTVVWTSDNPDVVALRSPQFNATTVIAEARGVGTATLTATTTDGSNISVTRTVTVSSDPNLVPDFCLDHNMITITSARFLTDQTWTIGNREWSDVVLSDQCADKDSDWTVEDHGGALATGWMTHCRKSEEGFGHGFSWCAVMRFRDILCPDGWRLPTAEDFIQLDIATGGEGLNRHSGNDPTVDARLAEGYVGKWGATPIGAWNTLAAFGIGEFEFENIGIAGLYWSSTEVNDASGRALNLVLPNPENPAAMRVINPVASGGKGTPIALRCVRDI